MRLPLSFAAPFHFFRNRGAEEGGVRRPERRGCFWEARGDEAIRDGSSSILASESKRRAIVAIPWRPHRPNSEARLRSPSLAKPLAPRSASNGKLIRSKEIILSTTQPGPKSVIYRGRRPSEAGGWSHCDLHSVFRVSNVSSPKAQVAFQVFEAAAPDDITVSEALPPKPP